MRVQKCYCEIIITIMEAVSSNISPSSYQINVIEPPCENDKNVNTFSDEIYSDYLVRTHKSKWGKGIREEQEKILSRATRRLQRGETLV